MRLKIMQAGEQVLRQKARDLTREEILSAANQQLIELMRETMRDAPGVGLAAPQIGMGIRMAVIEDSEQAADRERKPVPFHVIINPRIQLGDESIEFFEGCLSVAGFTGLVRRARTVSVDCLNERGEEIHIDANGWYARILQHEIDHLEGTLYVDRMETRSFMTTANFARYWKDSEIAAIRETLRLTKG